VATDFNFLVFYAKSTFLLSYRAARYHWHIGLIEAQKIIFRTFQPIETTQRLSILLTSNAWLLLFVLAELRQLETVNQILHLVNVGWHSKPFKGVECVFCPTQRFNVIANFTMVVGDGALKIGV
jgi:hypothetical protein